MWIIEIFSTTSLLLPVIVSRASQKDGLILLIIGSIEALIYVFFISNTIKRLNGKSYFEYIQENLGKVFSYILAIIYIVRFLIRGSFVLSLFSELMGKTLLMNESKNELLILMLIVCGYFATKGIKGRIRTMKILFLPIFIPIFIVLILALSKVSFENIKPVFEISIPAIVTGSYAVLLSYNAIELMLFNVTANNNINNYSKKNIFLSVLFVIGINLLIFVCVVGIFNYKVVADNLWSVINFLQNVRIPGDFLERLDLLMVIFWVFSMFGIISAYIFYSVDTLDKVLKHPRKNLNIVVILVTYFIIEKFLPNIETTFLMYQNYVAYIDFPVSIILPLIIVYFNINIPKKFIINKEQAYEKD